MRHFVQLQQPQTGEIRQVKVGWSWTLFFFVTWLGVPLYLRGLKGLATVFAVMFLLGLLLSLGAGASDVIGALALLLFLIQTAGSFWMGLKGNEVTARHYLSQGWRFVDDQSPAVVLANTKWHLPQNISEGSTPVSQIYPMSFKPILVGLAVISAIVLFFVLAADHGIDGLELQQQQGFVVMKNTGRQPIKIEDVSANDRPECKPHLGILLGRRFSPITIKVGNQAILSSPCSSVVRLTVKTSDGSATYTFSD